MPVDCPMRVVDRIPSESHRQVAGNLQNISVKLCSLKTGGAEMTRRDARTRAVGRHLAFARGPFMLLSSAWGPGEGSWTNLVDYDLEPFILKTHYDRSLLKF